MKQKALTSCFKKQKQKSSYKIEFEKFFCTAKEDLDPPRKLPLLVTTGTQAPLDEDFFDILAFGVHKPKLLHDFTLFL
jgi:hypothetical protein